MRIPFGSLTSHTSLQVLCACCAFWGMPAAAAARGGSVFFDRRVLTLLALACLVGMIAGWVGGGPRETGFRLLNKPKKSHLSVLVPPGPAPRLIPGDSPNATRAQRALAPLPRQTPADAGGSGGINYIAAFADSAEASEGAKVDYLLVSSENVDESPDSPEEIGVSLRQTG